MDQTKKSVEALSADVTGTIRSAAKSLTGWKRRRSPAEVFDRVAGQFAAGTDEGR